MPFYICPRCKNRRVDHDGREGFSMEVPSCHHCGFGFMFELLHDYYPAQATGFVVCDRDARVLATGEGIFELTGFKEEDLMGCDLVDALGLSDSEAVATVREWGVRKLEQKITLRTHAASALADDSSAVADVQREQQIHARLDQAPDLRNNFLDVKVYDGIAVLEGAVDSEQEKKEAQQLAHVDGILGVNNHLVIRAARK